jgi:hypothetical protein
VLRFWNVQLTEDLGGVLDVIESALGGHAPSSTPTPQPSPRGGEGEGGGNA